MKSKMKKLVSLVLAMAMVFTMCIGMSATQVEAADEYSITINSETSGHTYEAYQIFSGTLSTNTNGDKVLSDIVWGSGVDSDKVTDLITAIAEIEDSGSYPFKDCKEAADVAEVLKNYNDDTDVVNAFAEVVEGYLSSTPTGSTSTYVAATGTVGESDYVAAHYTITDLSAGYYLVKDEDDSLASSENEAYTSYILEVVGNAEVDTKSSVPSMTKKVQDANDSTDTADTVNDWQDSADYDIGDDVPFQLTATMPTTIGSYDTYSITFHDKMDSGLSFNSSSVVVKVGDTVVSSDCYTVKTDNLSDATCTFEIVFDNVLSLEDESSGSITVSAGTVIVVTYTAELTGDAVVIGNSGNWNEAYLEFSNNPYTDSTSTTPKDTVVVFTYALTINKVDTSGDALKGAAFTLYKYNKADNTWTTVELTTNATGTDATIFTATGLDDGIYKLVESETPTGYNTIDDIYFTVVASHVEDLDSASADEKANPLTSLVYTQVACTESGETSTYTGTPLTFKLADSSTFKEVSSVLTSIDVVNKSGSVLPSTGGIGTTIFYIVGAILVLGAGVVLVTRRRTSRQ